MFSALTPLKKIPGRLGFLTLGVALVPCMGIIYWGGTVAAYFFSAVVLLLSWVLGKQVQNQINQQFDELKATAEQHRQELAQGAEFIGQLNQAYHKSFTLCQDQVKYCQEDAAKEID